MRRELGAEILDMGTEVPEETVQRAYRDLTRIHRWLGDTGFIIRAIRRDPLPVRRVLDVGCATGGVLAEVQRKLDVDGVGVDMRPYPSVGSRVPIVKADAVRDPLPEADVAFCMHVGHHLSEGDLGGLIRNVGRSCRRFILLDLVRHPLPLALFRTFVAPFVSRVVVADGVQSIRRSYTPGELRGITAGALRGTGGAFRHSVAPLYARQAVDITY